MKSKWWGLRALGLHVALLAWLAMCATAAWWQVGRPIRGNSLSFMYAVEWPVFGVLGVLGWFAMLNMEKITEQQGGRATRVRGAHACRGAARRARPSREEEDPALAAYNDHLASLATKTKKRLWGH